LITPVTEKLIAEWSGFALAALIARRNEPGPASDSEDTTITLEPAVGSSVLAAMVTCSWPEAIVIGNKTAAITAAAEPIAADCRVSGLRTAGLRSSGDIACPSLTAHLAPDNQGIRVRPNGLTASYG